MYVLSIVFFAFWRCKWSLIVMNTKQLVTGGEIAGTAATAAPYSASFYVPPELRKQRRPRTALRDVIARRA